MKTSARVLRGLLTRRIAVPALLVFLVLSPGADSADSAVPADGAKKLTVVLHGLEKDEQKNVEGLLEIWQFHNKESPSTARLHYLHRKAAEQIALALRPFGYYRSSVESDLSDLGQQWQAVYRITPGDRILIRELKLEVIGDVEQHEEFRTALKTHRMQSGEALDQQVYEDLKQSLQTTASQLGYFDSEFLQHQIRVDLKSYTADVAMVFDTGPRYKIGSVSLEQDVEWLSEQLLAKFNDIEDQQYFDARDLQELQSDLSGTEYYSEVQVRALAEDAEDLVIPVKVELTHKSPRQYVYSIGYETDTGLRLKYGVTGRRINSAGHQFSARANVSQIGIGADATYTVPVMDPRTDSFGFRIGYEEEHTDERDFRSLALGGIFGYKDGYWFKTYATNYHVDEFKHKDDKRVTELLVPVVQWTRTFPEELEKRVNAVNGSWLSLRLRGASDTFFSDTSFLQPTISAKWIKTLGDESRENRSRLIARTRLGITYADDFSKIPLSLRYYTGGDATVRGYGYNKIGPLEDGKVTGGKHLIEGSLEFEKPFKENWSWALFADVGDAFDNRPDYRVGLGVGVRWRSPIGPVRLDLGRSLNKPGQGNVKVHFSLGPDL